MVITATEFKTNFGKYLKILVSEDIFLTKNGKTIAKISNPNISAVDSLSGMLSGYIPDDYTAKDLRNERMAKYEIAD